MTSVVLGEVRTKLAKANMAIELPDEVMGGQRMSWTDKIHKWKVGDGGDSL